MVRKPTRGDNVLALIFFTEEDLISEVEVSEALAGSDHKIVQCMVSTPHPRIRGSTDYSK